MTEQRGETMAMTAESETVLEMRNATVTFEMEHGESTVLDSVDLDVYRGEVLGVVGESGSGKSMLAESLLDAIVDPGQLNGEITYYPESGSPVDVLNQSSSEINELRWEGVSLVFQGTLSSFNPTMGIESHFRETLEAHGADVETGMEHARDLLSDLHLDPERIFDSYAHELSGGMKQRVSIALSLVLEPDVLIMDEPTAALDLLMQRSIISLIDDIQAEYDITIVFITHDLELISTVADRVAVMYSFEIAEIGPAQEIIRNARHPYTRALINSTPNLETSVELMKPIEGKSPAPTNVPAGCSYHPRCPLSDEQCRISDPKHYDVDPNHTAACHYWEQVDDEISTAIDDVGQDTVSEQSGVDPSSVGSSESAETVISVEDLTVHFENSSGVIRNLFSTPDIVRAVDGVDIEIENNEAVVLIGESGCGKTTLGRTVIGGQEPTGGSVKYRGQDIREAKLFEGEVRIPYEEIRRSLQMIHQDPGDSLNPTRTVRSILARPLQKWASHLTAEERLSRIYGLLQRVGMAPPENYVDRYPHQLSGGEQQRVALSRALLMNPDLIMADEILSALDVSLRIDMMDLLIDLQDDFDTAFLLISHNLSNARYIAEKMDGRIGIMYLGEIVEMGPPNEVLTNPQHPYTAALKWATPKLDPDIETVDDPPIRDIDVPDPVDPPSGCRFHTRCPKAREICVKKHPQPEDTGSEDTDHQSACFRAFGDDHEYWDSPSIVD